MVPERVAQTRALIDDLTQHELDALSGLARGHVSMIETGRRPNIEAKTALGLARVLGVTMEWLLTGEGKAPTSRTVRAAVERAREAAKGVEAEPKAVA